MVRSYGTKAVVFGRLLPVMRTFISLPAGFAAMPPVRFGAYTLAGCVPVVTGLSLAGYLVGASWQTVADESALPTRIIAAVIAVLALGALSLPVTRTRRHRRITVTEPTRLCGRSIHLAAHAIRTIRETALDRAGIPFTHWQVLDKAPGHDRDELTHTLVELTVDDEAGVARAIDQLQASSEPTSGVPCS